LASQNEKKAMTIASMIMRALTESGVTDL
jgi:hypothetical protein